MNVFIVVKYFLILSQDYFRLLREKFPILKIAIFNVRAEIQTVLKRAAERAEVTGRIVPDSVCMYVCMYVCMNTDDLIYALRSVYSMYVTYSIHI